MNQTTGTVRLKHFYKETLIGAITYSSLKE